LGSCHIHWGKEERRKGKGTADSSANCPLQSEEKTLGMLPMVLPFPPYTIWTHSGQPPVLNPLVIPECGLVNVRGKGPQPP